MNEAFPKALDLAFVDLVMRLDIPCLPRRSQSRRGAVLGPILRYALLMLARFEGAPVTADRLAELMGVSRNTVHHATRTLEEYGFVTKVRRHNGNEFTIQRARLAGITTRAQRLNHHSA